MGEVHHCGVPFVNSVFHPTDFSSDSEKAFQHALALTLRRQTSLTIMNAGPTVPEQDWTRIEPIRSTLSRWGLLGPSGGRSADFEELRPHVRKVSVVGRTPLAAITDYLANHPTDLIVLATESRGGTPRWLTRSVAEEVARASHTMTLFVRTAARGFVDPESGDLRLRRILIPVDRRPDPRGALLCACRAARFTGEGGVELTLLHVGEPAGMPPLLLPESPECRWVKVERSGEVVETISAFAAEEDVDLIVMATEGHHGILDALRGSVTEQVLRRAPCPLLAVPWARA